MKRFSAKTVEELRYYVYLYIDPRDGQPFYIGKGQSNRAFAHLSAKGDSEKAKRIRAIRKAGYTPQIEILKYRLSEKQALLVESTAIDLLDIKNLTNTVRGHGSKHGARASAEQVEAELNPVEVEIDDPVLLINIRTSYHHDITPMELYDVTRSAWRLSQRGGRRDRVRYAFSVFGGVVREVYRVNAWVPAGSSMRLKDTEPGRDGRPPLRPKRWEFIGHVAEPKARSKYLGRSVSHYFPAGNQNPVKYVGCD